MVFKHLMAATASIGLMATPAMAAGSPSTVTVQAANAEVSPTSETIQGLQFGGNGVLIIGAVILVGLGIWALIGDDDDNDEPLSP